MSRKDRFVKRKITAAILALSVILSASSAPAVYAADRDEKIIKAVETASLILEEGINKSLADTENYIKAECLKNDYDYYFTMESFYQQENPYKDADYIELIASYMTAKTYTRTLEKKDFYSLPFIDTDIKTEYIEEYESVELPKYVEEDDGKYIRKGTYLVDMPLAVNEYRKTSDGRYEICGTKDVKLKSISTKYGKITLSAMDAEDILEYYGLSENKKALKSYENKVKQLKSIINGNNINESLFLSFRQFTMNDSDKEYITSLVEDKELSLNRKKTILTGISLLGKVPYEYGGKAAHEGYDKTWWTFGNSGKQKGLDCSGYMQWILMTAGYEADIYGNCISTSVMLNNLETADFESLVPGDFGFLQNAEDEGINHVGIYLGDGRWMHCSSKAGVPVMEKTDMFKIYRRLPQTDSELPMDMTEALLKAEIITGKMTDIVSDTAGMIQFEDIYNSECPFTEEDILLTAKLIYNEARGEGLNGWIAVAEIVKNRLNSELFPDTIKDVIYEKNQFSGSDKIEGRRPSHEMITVAREVLSGNMSVLEDDSILFFRNANGSTNDWGKYIFQKSIGNHQFYKIPEEDDMVNDVMSA